MTRTGMWHGWPAVLAGTTLLVTAAGCVAVPGPGPGPFPNLNGAESQLQGAIIALRQAPPIFGGHKAEAVRLIEAAIGEIEAAKNAAE